MGDATNKSRTARRPEPTKGWLAVHGAIRHCIHTTGPLLDLMSALGASRESLSPTFRQHFPHRMEGFGSDAAGNVVVRRDGHGPRRDAADDYGHHFDAAQRLHRQLQAALDERAEREWQDAVTAMPFLHCLLRTLPKIAAASNRCTLATKLRGRGSRQPREAVRIDVVPLTFALSMRLWHLQAWLAELALAVAIKDATEPCSTDPETIDLIARTERRIATTNQRGKVWLRSNVLVAGRQRNVEIASACHCQQVGTLAWPNDLGGAVVMRTTEMMALAARIGVTHNTLEEGDRCHVTVNGNHRTTVPLQDRNVTYLAEVTRVTARSLKKASAFDGPNGATGRAWITGTGKPGEMPRLGPSQTCA